MKRDAGRIIIAGCSGSGKTTLMMKMLAGRQRIIALDPKGKTFSGMGYKRCTNLTQVYKEIKAGWNTGFKIHVPTGKNIGVCLDLFAKLTDALFLIQEPYYEGRRGMANKTITLAIDEADLFMPLHNAPTEIQHRIDDLTRRSRDHGIEMIANSQRLSQLAATFRGNCTEGYFMAPGIMASDLKAMCEILGSSYKSELGKLKVGEYFYKGGLGAEVKKGRTKL